MSQSKSECSPRNKGVLASHLDKVHSIREQFSHLRSYLNELLRSIPAYREPGKRQALLDHILEVVRSHGRSGLKIHKNLFILGVKTLGGDQTDFSGFKTDKDGYPRHYGDLFRLLKSYGETTRQRFEGLNDTKIFGENGLLHIRAALSVLRWAYYIKLDMTDDEKKAELNKFSEAITKATLPEHLERFCEYAPYGLLRYVSKSSHGFDPLRIVPSKRTYKGSRPGNRTERRFPKTLLSAVGEDFKDLSLTWGYSGPVGRVTVLSERAGKSRVITSYDGSINSSNLYEKVRSVLDVIPQDVSDSQGSGHQVLKALTGSYNRTSNSTGVSDMKSDMIISADLSNFSDTVHLAALESILGLLGATDFLPVITSPVEVNGSVVTPLHALMGLKGTFELCTLVHHGVLHLPGVNSLLTRKAFELGDYVMCGDDLVMRSTNANWKRLLSSYESVAGSAGLSLNRSKTVVSESTGVFCGKVYHLGFDVSPLGPATWTLSASFTDFISSAGQLVDEARKVGRVFVQACRVLISSYGSRYSGKFFPMQLPRKLGGLSFPGSDGLLSILEQVRYRVFCRFSDEEDPPPRITRRYPLKDRDEEPLFVFTPNLLVRGYTLLLPKKNSRFPQRTTLKTVHECLEYFYFG